MKNENRAGEDEVVNQIMADLMAVLSETTPEGLKWVREEDDAKYSRDLARIALYAADSELGDRPLALIRVNHNWSRAKSPIQIMVVEGGGYSGAQYYRKRKDGSYNIAGAVERAFTYGKKKLEWLESKRMDIQLTKVWKGEIEKAVGYPSETTWHGGTAEFRLRSESGGQIRVRMDPNKDYDAVRVYVSGDGVTFHALAAMIKDLEASGWKVV